MNEVLGVEYDGLYNGWLYELCCRKIVKEPVDCTKSVEQFTSKGKDFGNEVSAVLFLQQNRACVMLFELR